MFDPISEHAQLQLKQLVRQQMPFGKYQGYALLDLPFAYLAWFAKKGFPQGELGAQLALLYQLKLDGNGDVLRLLQRQLAQ